MTLATSALAVAGRRADALAAWRSASDNAPTDADVAAGWFEAAATALDYGALAPAAARVARLEGGDRAWWPAAATAVQAVGAPGSSPLGRPGLLKLASAMVAKLEKSAGDELTEQQRALVACVRAEVEGGGAVPQQAPPPPPPAKPSRRHTMLRAIEEARTDPAAAAAAAAAYMEACGREPYAAPSTVAALAPPLPPPVAAAVAQAARTAAGDDPARIAAAETVAASLGCGAGATELLARVPPAPPPDAPVAIAVQACAALVSDWRATKHPSTPPSTLPLVAALLITDAATVLDARAPAPRLAAAALAGALGDAASVHAHFLALSLKHVLLDTVAGHLVLPPLLATGDARTSAHVTSLTLAMHAGATSEVGTSLTAAFDAGYYSVAVDLARFAAFLRASRAHAAAAVAQAVARVEGAAVEGVAELKAACAASVADLRRAGWAVLVGDDDASPSSSTFTWTDDLVTRPHWLPPAGCDDRLAVASWWAAGGDVPPPSTAWWCRHGAAAADTRHADTWRRACTASLTRRACVPWLTAAVLGGQDVRSVVKRVWGGGDGDAASLPTDQPLHTLPDTVAATFWRAAAATTVALHGGDAAATTTDAAALLTLAATAMTHAGATIASTLDHRDTGLLIGGAWGPALAVAHTAALAAACAGTWKGKGGGDELRQAILAYTASIRTAMDRLAEAARAAPARGTATAVAAALAAGHGAVIGWVSAAGLNVERRVQGLVAGQAAVLVTVAVAVRGAVTVAARK